MQKTDGKYYMICPNCGPYHLCYEEYYEKDFTIPFAMRLIYHQDEVAKISDLISFDEKDDCKKKFQIVKCSHCHSIVNVKQHAHNIINSEEVICLS